MPPPPPPQHQHQHQQPRAYSTSHPPPPMSTSTISTPSTTTTSTPQQVQPSYSPYPLPPAHLAISHATLVLPPLQPGCAFTSCANAALLSALLANVLGALSARDRLLWCQLMDSLAMRVGMGDVSYSVAIAPAVFGVAEACYTRHVTALLHHVGMPCKSVPATGGGRGGDQFGWVEEDDDDNGQGDLHVEERGVATFEGYVCDVLDDEGRAAFVRERWYHGGLDTRRLFQSAGWCEAAEDEWESASEGGEMSGVSDSGSWDARMDCGG